MSYIFNNAIKYSDGPALDAFGRLRTAGVQNLLDIKHILDKNPLLVSEVTGGGGTSVFTKEFARVRMSTSANNDYVIRQSKSHPTYQPGKSQLFEASFSNFQLETNVIKRIGGFASIASVPYDSQLDGYFLESNGVTGNISFQIHRSGVTVYNEVITSWKDNEFNPNDINWSKSNLLIVDYQWLGVGRMRFGLNISGQTYYFAEHNNANDDVDVYMSSPNQPIRYEIRQQGAGSGYFDMLCSQVSTEGAINDLNSSTSIIHTTVVTMTTSGTKYPYIGYRLKSDGKSTLSQINDISILNTSNDNYLVTLELNPTISALPSWTDINNTPIQYSLGVGASTVTSAGHIISSVIGQGGTSAITKLQFDSNQIRVGSNIDGTLDEMWVCITPLGANATFLGSSNILYYV